MDDEKNLIEKVLSGDMDSFRMLVEEYQGLVFSLCLNIVKDRFDAENLAQETFIKVYNSLSGYNNKGFKTWISRIAVNSSIDFKRQKVRMREESMPPGEIPVNETGLDPSIEEIIVSREEASNVRKLCDSLPDIYRTVLLEYYISSKSIRQIAEEGGLNEKTVETRLYRALKMVGNKWKEGYG